MSKGVFSAALLVAATLLASGSSQVRASGRTSLLLALIADHKHASTPAERAQTPLPADRSRVEYLVRPRSTDSRIGGFLQDHYVIFNKSVRQNGRLFVFFSGTFGVPRDYQLVLNEAANLGYKAIGLEYPDDTDNPNRSDIAGICGGDPDPACADKVRQETASGSPATAKVNVTPPSGVKERLVALLRYLSKRHPGDHWSSFLSSQGVRWGRLVLAGHSEGAGMAAFLAKRHVVSRVVLWSGGTDYIPAIPGFADWVGDPSATPANRYYGMVHRQDPAFLTVLRGWDLLGLARFGPPVLFRRHAMQGVHEVVVDHSPRGPISVGNADHASTATDRATPLASDGTPFYRLAWDDVLGP